MENNGIITMMRGDTLTKPIYINIGTKLSPDYYSLQEGDSLYFGLMEPTQAFEDAILKIKYDHSSLKDSNNNVLLILKPTDTEKLLVGKYYYMIKLKTKDEYGLECVKTIVPPTLFWIEGNNVKQEKESYYDKGHYEIDRLVFDGGEII